MTQGVNVPAARKSLYERAFEACGWSKHSGDRKMALAWLERQCKTGDFPDIEDWSKSLVDDDSKRASLYQLANQLEMQGLVRLHRIDKRARVEIDPSDTGIYLTNLARQSIRRATDAESAKVTLPGGKALVYLTFADDSEIAAAFPSETPTAETGKNKAK